MNRRVKQDGAGVWRRLLAYTRHSRLTFAGIFIFTLAGNVCLLLAPRLVGAAIDCIRPQEGTAFFVPLLRLIALLAGLYLTGTLLQWLSAQCANVAANRAVRALRTDLFRKLGTLPLPYYDSHSHGDLISRFSNDMDAIADGLNQGLAQLVSGLFTIVLSLVFMFALNPLVTLVVLFVTPLCFLVGYAVTRYGSRRFRAQSQTLGKLNGCAEELISGQRTVKAFGYEPQAAERFRTINAALYECGYRAQFASALVNPLTRFVNNLAYVLVGICGILLKLSAGGIASFLTYTAQFAKPFNEITAITMQLQLAAAAARRVFEVMDAPEQTPEPADGAQLPCQPGTVRFSHVAFAYRPDRPLIRDFSLEVLPGTMVAIVGPTGAGKTTLVNLLLRFYEVNAGTISVDGRDITTVTRDSLRRCFGMVLQETWLFAGTIRDNLAYGRPDATQEEIEAAARAAHAHSFIRRLPEGYQTHIAEDGGNLSQGQKQLLTIARAMLVNSPMLILDEATSSVDILTEQRIQRAFSRMMEGKTSFVIAHRLSTIRDADRILVLENGNVVDTGTHEELLARPGVYRRLYEAQFAAEEGASAP